MMNLGTIITHPGQWLPAGLAALCMLLAVPAAADIYKWTGDDGKVNYTQMPPPPGYTVESIKQTTSPSKDKNPATRSPASKLDERRKEAGQDKQKDTQSAEQSAANDEIRRLNCDAASRNLAALLEKSQRSFMTANGELLRPTEEERAGMIADTRKQVEEYCEG